MIAAAGIIAIGRDIGFELVIIANGSILVAAAVAVIEIWRRGDLIPVDLEEVGLLAMLVFALNGVCYGLAMVFLATRRGHVFLGALETVAAALVLLMIMATMLAYRRRKLQT